MGGIENRLSVLRHRIDEQVNHDLKKLRAQLEDSLSLPKATPRNEQERKDECAHEVSADATETPPSGEARASSVASHEESVAPQYLNESILPAPSGLHQAHVQVSSSENALRLEPNGSEPTTEFHLPQQCVEDDVCAI